MFVRIVKMSFEPSKIDAFLAHFELHKHDIRNFEGCNCIETKIKLTCFLPIVFGTKSTIWSNTGNLNCLNPFGLRPNLCSMQNQKLGPLKN